MKLLIIGASGMAGHMLVDYFQKCSPYSVSYTTREKGHPTGLFLDVRDPVAVEKVVEAVAPDIVINGAGILNEAARQHEVDAYLVNGLLPHQLKRLVERAGSRLVHISSDCVFSGERGQYKESDPPDGTTVYAKSKALGEVTGDGTLTIRTSIIGPEIRRHGIGLMHWFMQQQGTVKGYTKVMWNGVTTLELAKAIHYYIEHPASGLLHLTAPKTVSKCELLELMRDIFDKTDVTIVPDDGIKLDRTLQQTRSDAAFRPLPYRAMLRELREWMRPL